VVRYSLANGTYLIPLKKLSHFRVLEWQLFEQYSQESNIAVGRFIEKYLRMPEMPTSVFEEKYKAVSRY
jgi:glutathione S-transferase